MTEHKDHADVKIHPPVLLLLHLAAVMLLAKIFRLPQDFIPTWVGYPVVLFGFGLAFSAMMQFGRAKTTVDPHGSVSAIVVNGPYRFSRNPIYVGLVCFLIGMPLVLGTLWGLVLSPLFIVLMNSLVIQHEEAYLEKKFGDDYTSFKSRVRRWL
jgi:protein-S-isoprenylcysteine O-methyltransferase Ste14